MIFVDTMVSLGTERELTMDSKLSRKMATTTEATPAIIMSPGR